MSYIEYHELKQLDEKKTVTNSDRIRAMSDEELAEFLEGDYGNMMVGTALKWLKEPAGGADHE